MQVDDEREETYDAWIARRRNVWDVEKGLNHALLASCLLGIMNTIQTGVAKCVEQGTHQQQRRRQKGIS